MEAAPLKALRVEFFKAYPADGAEKQKDAARRKAWERQLERGRDKGLVCTRDIEGEDFIWIVAPSVAPPPNVVAPSVAASPHISVPEAAADFG